jgi:hypothetical protein
MGELSPSVLLNFESPSFLRNFFVGSEKFVLESFQNAPLVPALNPFPFEISMLPAPTPKLFEPDSPDSPNSLASPPINV